MASKSADSTRALAEQLAAVLPGRNVEPALASAEETALVGKAKEIGGLRERELQPAEILLGKLAPGAVEQFDERRFLLLQAPLQGALAHAQLAGDLVAPRLAVRQMPNDHLARPIARLRVIEVAQIDRKSTRLNSSHIPL